MPVDTANLFCLSRQILSDLYFAPNPQAQQCYDEAPCQPFLQRISYIGARHDHQQRHHYLSALKKAEDRVPGKGFGAKLWALMDYHRRQQQLTMHAATHHYLAKLDSLGTAQNLSPQVQLEEEAAKLSQENYQQLQSFAELSLNEQQQCREHVAQPLDFVPTVVKSTALLQGTTHRIYQSVRSTVGAVGTCLGVAIGTLISPLSRNPQNCFNTIEAACYGGAVGCIDFFS